MQSTIPSEVSLSQQSGSMQNSFGDSLTGKIVIPVAASLFIAACAHISLPLPFTPVPLTLQNFAVVLVGILLGPVAGFSAVVLYLAEGAMGLPVFPPHSVGGVAHLIGPNAGYLFSYPLAAAIGGWVVRALKPVTTRFRSGLVAAIAASVPVFILGAAWLSHFLHIGASATWALAVAPFLPGDAIKITAIAAIYSGMQRWQRS